MTKARILLIEPVWNRNICEECFEQVEANSFNRTSMESKRCYNALRAVKGNTFNRTSMESKHERDQNCERRAGLLIEPVWNRNCIAESAQQEELVDF